MVAMRAATLGVFLSALQLAAAADTSTSTTTTAAAAAAAAAAQTTSSSSSSTTTTVADAAAAAAAAAVDTSTSSSTSSSSTTTNAAAAAAAAGVATTSSSTTTPGVAATTKTSTSSTSSSKTTTTAAAAAAEVTTTATTASTSSTSTSSSVNPSSTDYLGPWTNLDYLEGTWVSKSGMVVTGPDFFDPVEELLIEPALPGISYSFTKDGYWEEAIYQVTSNGTDPKCAVAAVIYQHGTYTMADNGTLTLTPFAVDGRQLLSDPCGQSSSEAIYSRYVQEEVFEKFTVYVDNYYGRYRLNLYESDGTPMMPLYLAYKPPQMLPTITMLPTASNDPTGYTGTGGAASATSTSSSSRAKARRALMNRARTTATRQPQKHPYADSLWWLGVTCMGAGAIGFVMLS